MAKAKKLYLTLLTAVLISGCATPHVVEQRQLRDDQLSCSELHYQMQEADRFEKEARDERKVTGTNVAAAVLFWPALLGTYSNTKEAIDAARERREHLQGLYRQKGCN